VSGGQSSALWAGFPSRRRSRFIGFFLSFLPATWTKNQIMTSMMEAPVVKITGDVSSASQDRQPHHHHHHHHHHEHLTRYTGGSEQATGKRVLVGVDGSEHSNYALDWFFDHLWSPDNYLVLLNCPDLHDVVKSQWSGGKYVFDREVVDLKLKEGEAQIHHDLEKFKDKLVKHA
ncbi:hypothetical protein EGW08_006163, partial [Elysia chlorotica]